MCLIGLDDWMGMTQVSAAARPGDQSPFASPAEESPGHRRAKGAAGLVDRRLIGWRGGKPDHTWHAACEYPGARNPHHPHPKRRDAMPKVSKPANQKGEFLVDYEEKVFEDVKAEPGEKALVTFHTVAFEGSIGFVNLLQATRLQRKGFETSVLLYGPGVTLGVKRGFPTLGDEAFPGHQNFNNQITKFIGEGGKVYACRFALQALYGHGEGALIDGIRPINPLDVLDIILLHRKADAFILDTWTL
jgi:uncharacterized repeat protein (TIGR04044 family)